GSRGRSKTAAGANQSRKEAVCLVCPAAVERSDLARTILAKRPPEAQPLVELEDELTYDDHEVEHEAGNDPAAEGLGLGRR
ncbi:MAG: hypothetical protein Q7R41_05145, partial [Phycisphaerales bacterium]|nr:hypothetical protein [Phycisphaerales bacterium]